jgi:predicted membrane GTPase involved in stress response
MIMQLNKVHSVKTIDRVAAELGETIDRLFDLAIDMETEDGVIWVYGPGDDSVIAFTPFGIENLQELIEMDAKHAR